MNPVKPADPVNATAPTRPPSTSPSEPVPRVLRVALPQWRLARDRFEAAGLAAAVRADQIDLDFGGGARGARLDRTAELGGLSHLRAHLAVDTLAVNHANDLGLHREGRVNQECLALVLRAADVAVAHGFAALHVPSFRASAVRDAAGFGATAEFLGRCARHAPGLRILTESDLGAHDAISLVSAVGEPQVAVVADTGNLIDAGHDPAAFVGACHAAGVLDPVVHVKTPARAATGPWVGHDTAALLDAVAWAARTVLLENDYLSRPDLLRVDVDAVRALARPDLPAGLAPTPRGALR